MGVQNSMMIATTESAFLPQDVLEYKKPPLQVRAHVAAPVLGLAAVRQTMDELHDPTPEQLGLEEPSPEQTRAIKLFHKRVYETFIGSQGRQWVQPAMLLEIAAFERDLVPHHPHLDGSALPEPAPNSPAALERSIATLPGTSRLPGTAPGKASSRQSVGGGGLGQEVDWDLLDGAWSVAEFRRHTIPPGHVDVPEQQRANVFEVWLRLAALVGRYANRLPVSAEADQQATLWTPNADTTTSKLWTPDWEVTSPQTLPSNGVAGHGGFERGLKSEAATWLPTDDEVDWLLLSVLGMGAGSSSTYEERSGMKITFEDFRRKDPRAELTAAQVMRIFTLPVVIGGDNFWISDPDRNRPTVTEDEDPLLARVNATRGGHHAHYSVIRTMVPAALEKRAAGKRMSPNDTQYARMGDMLAAIEKLPGGFEDYLPEYEALNHAYWQRFPEEKGRYLHHRSEES